MKRHESIYMIVYLKNQSDLGYTYPADRVEEPLIGVQDDLIERIIVVR